MKISVIIVNYKVPYFLRQCLYSTRKALNLYNEKYSETSEIIVFDNNSEDGSQTMCERFFPSVKYIQSSENLGFSRANNAAYKVSSGEFLLILNPDTLIPENLFLKLIPYMEAHKNIGALGVKLVDATGAFHPEAKRAYPTPARAFYKLFGLAYLFPKSARFNQYQLGKIPPDALHEVEILVGAFMLMRREAADKTALFDEDFFMYGEDIDLSYRVLKTGFKNFYYGKISVLHYKGESTKIHTHKYVRVFYEAMQIFVKKHFAGRSHIGALLLSTAVWLRRMLAHGVLSIKNIFRKAKFETSSKIAHGSILLIGDDADKNILLKTYNNATINLLQTLWNKADRQKQFKEITENINKISPDIVIFNIEKYSVEMFIDLIQKYNDSDINFYTLVGGTTCIIGKNVELLQK